MEFDFSKTQEEAEKNFNLGAGQYFKIKEGANRVRLVSICLPHESTFKGKKNFKWLCQILDRKDGVVKPFFMPHTIYGFIRDLQLDPDYSFTEIPMPYDVTIKAIGAGNKEVKYSLTPARESVPLTQEEKNLIVEAPTIKQLQAKILENEKENTVPETENKQVVEDLAEEIPF